MTTLRKPPNQQAAHKNNTLKYDKNMETTFIYMEHPINHTVIVC